jgi:hypothetical protein
LELKGVQLKFRKDVKFWNLRSLFLEKCTDSKELVRSVAPRLEVFKMISMPQDLMIEGDHFYKLKVGVEQN